MTAALKQIWLLGHPIAHSLSPAMHQAAFRHLGLDWCYEARDVTAEQLPSVFQSARAAGVLGMNVTVPHKVAVLELVDEVDATAKLFGAVNTVVWRDGKSRGYNTDGHGLAMALREEFQLELRGKSVAILGAGGAAQAAVMQCATEGAREILILNRTVEKAELLAAKIRAQFPDVMVRAGCAPKAGAFFRNRKIDLMINATSLGLRPHDPSPIVCDDLAGVPFVYDMIYRPAETKCLKCAREAGARTANGLSMLLHQGVRALELWLQAHVPERRLSPPVDVMRTALMNNSEIRISKSEGNSNAEN